MRHYHFILGRRWARARRDGTPKPERLQNMARLLVVPIRLGDGTAALFEEIPA